MILKPPYEVEHDENDTYVALPNSDWAVAKALGISAAERKEHAAFIVRACNSHDELVAALKDARTFIARDWQSNPEHVDAELARIDAALAKLEA